MSTSEFEKAGARQHRRGLVAELWAFMSQNKKWWLLPLLLMLGLFGALVMLSGSAAAPFIYTLF
jgi:hypothetical protein